MMLNVSVLAKHDTGAIVLPANHSFSSLRCPLKDLQPDDAAVATFERCTEHHMV